MLKFIGQRNGKKFVGFGLTEKNIEKLKAGDPILVTQESWDNQVEGPDFLIFYGKDEQGLSDELVKMGLLSKKTRVHISPGVAVEVPGQEIH